MNDSRGSQWRKWDLHVHSQYSQEKRAKLSIEKIFKEAIRNHIEVIAITDHSNVDGLDEIWEFWENEKIEINGKNQKISDLINFLPAVELKSDKGKRGVHFIAVFPKKIKNKKVDKKYLKVDFLAKIGCSENDIENSGKGNYKKGLLEHCVSFEKTVNKIHELGGVVIGHAGTKSNGIEQEIAHSRDDAGDYEVLNSLGPKKEDLMKNYIDICEVPNRNKNNKTEAIFYLNKFGKPTILSSDSHENYKGDKFTWIKADPTFEGLKQILYEPEPSERVWIGSTLPDQKNNYQVIKKIKFSNTDDFPEEVVFNQNLCSVIGSRSSGKSALLAYIAHAVDKDLAESLITGPGEGNEYTWDKIENSRLKYEVEWVNNLTNNKSNGKIVFIPQNHLFKESKRPEEIKKRIKPILFKKFPEFKTKYEESVRRINTFNNKIINLVKGWFKLSDDIENIRLKIKDLGDKRSIEKEKKETEEKISIYRKKYSLNEEETEKYKETKKQIAELENKIQQNNRNIENIYSVLGNKKIFSDLKLEPEPELENLPQRLIEKISKKLQETKISVLSNVNKIVNNYVDSLESETKENKTELQKIKDDNKNLFDKYEKNNELENLIQKVAECEQILKTVEGYIRDIRDKESLKNTKIKGIKRMLISRNVVLHDLKIALDDTNQSNEDIEFLIEYEIKEEKLGMVAQKINLKEATEFVKDHRLRVKNIRKKVGRLLSDIYYNKQKINKGFDKKEVAMELLTLTEDILFVGKMEGDKIGGFSETNMTPGRRALFLLKLILAESDDKWPILLDQPEDNLDSRSITDEIVPFLKKKKKERQIIMVSHNANLVIGADSEQIIVANRNGNDRPNEDGKQFNYLTGSIENTKEKDKSIKDTLRCQGIREHACLILDGGKEAFEHRRNKYNLTKI